MLPSNVVRLAKFLLQIQTTMKFDTEHDRFVVRYIALQYRCWDVVLGITVHANIRMHYD